MTVADSIDVQGGILVAHDGSASADSALRTAASWAGAFKTHVTVVRAWSMTSAPRPDSWTAGYTPPLEDYEASTLAALEHDVSPVRELHPDVTITTTVVHGAAAGKLIEASPKVDLLVVGSRGLGGFKGLMLGSVSDQVVRYAQCRVAVDRGANPDETTA
jgi:nucleotide-binding universal stress UspA family protein|nr:universal stress protein UspA [Aeromicrobium sp.]